MMMWWSPAVLEAGSSETEVAPETASVSTLDAAITAALTRAEGNESKAAGILWMRFQSDKVLALDAMIQLIRDSRDRTGFEDIVPVISPRAAVDIGITVTNLPGNAAPSQGHLRALEKSRNSSAASIFDRVRLHSGRSIGNVHYNEFSSLIEDGELIGAIREYLGFVPVDKRGCIRDMMTATDLSQLVHRIKTGAI